MLLLVVSLVLIAIAPFSIRDAAFLWQLHHADRELDGRIPKPRLRLSLILAATGSISAVAAFVLALASLAGLSGQHDLATALTPLALAGIVALDCIPIINARYLRWLKAPASVASVEEEVLPP